MNLKFKRKIFSFVATFGLVFSFAMPSYAQFSILPYAQGEGCNGAGTGKDKVCTYDDCKKLMMAYEVEKTPNDLLSTGKRNVTLGCAIQTGRISFDMAPYFITYITNFLLGLSGLICVLFIVIGGYRYVIGGLTEEKEKGKHTIRDALMGMGIALLAWTVVNVLIGAVTG